MPKNLKDVRIALKKGEVLGGFEQWSLEEAKQTLSSLEIPDGQVKATCTHIVDGFKKFYVTWEHQSDGLKLLNEILTVREKQRLLEQLTADRPGIVVLVRKGGLCVRAKILDRTVEGKVLVRLTDYGTEETAELAQ